MSRELYDWHVPEGQRERVFVDIHDAEDLILGLVPRDIAEKLIEAHNRTAKAMREERERDLYSFREAQAIAEDFVNRGQRFHGGLCEWCGCRAHEEHFATCLYLKARRIAPL